MSIFAYSRVHIRCKQNNQHLLVDLHYRGEYEFLCQIFFNINMLHLIINISEHVWLSERKKKRQVKMSHLKIWSYTCICSGSQPGQFQSRRGIMGINVLPPKQHLKTLYFCLTITKNHAPSCTFFLKWHIPQHYETKQKNTSCSQTNWRRTVFKSWQILL